SLLINLTRIVGPAAAGILIGMFGSALVFLIDALSYLIVVYMLLIMTLPPFVGTASNQSRMEILAGGLKEVFRNPRLRTVLGLLFFVSTFGWSFQTLMPAIAQDIVGLSATRYGFVMSAFGI